MTDAPALPIRAISETLIQSVGVMRDMLTHCRELMKAKWIPQRAPLRTFPSAQSLVVCALKLQILIDTFQGSFGELQQGFVYPNLNNEALARQNEFWWRCARAAAELGTLKSSSPRVKRAESMVRAIANDLATFAGPSNMFANSLSEKPKAGEEKFIEDSVIFTLESLVESPTGKLHYGGPFAADELDVESRLLAELSRVEPELSADEASTAPIEGRPFDAMHNSLRTNWHEWIEKFKAIGEGMREQQRRQEEGFERVSRAIESVGPAPMPVLQAPALPATPPKPEATHNADFTMAMWFGTEYHFALGVQSSAVQALWEEWNKSGLGLHQDTIRDAIDAERDNFRMDTAFRNHPAFGTMIERCGDGKYRLAPPTPKSTPTASQPKKKRQSAPESRLAHV